MRSTRPLKYECLASRFIRLAGLLLLMGFSSAHSCDVTAVARDADGGEIKTFFSSTNKEAVTFVGYSGAEYEDLPQMLKIASSVLDEMDASKMIVNIGGTPEGIGAVYELAKNRGFETVDIVSSEAREYDATLSPCVDHVFYVQDKLWGGYVDGRKALSPTSARWLKTAMS
jgi:hypothetical protein